MTPAKYRLKADRALASAKLLLDDGDGEGACNRAYYAMFDAANAALLAAGGVAGAETRTHRGLIAAFGKHLVLTGHVEAELGRALNMIEKLRKTADYFGEPPSLDDARWAVEQAGAFVEALRAKFPPS